MADDIYDLALGDDFTTTDIYERIQELREMDEEERESQAAERALYDHLTLEDELVKLEDFKARVGLGLGQAHIVFIRDNAWDTYAYEYAIDVFGEAATTIWWDSGKFANDLLMDFKTVELLGYYFYYRA